MKFHYGIALVTLAFGFGQALANGTASQSSGAQMSSKLSKHERVFFVNLKNGATIPSNFTVKFGVSGMTVAPAGTNEPNTGHHHLLIDAQGPIAKGMMVPPADGEKVFHFGKGQTETQLNLTPGAHTLTLQFADGNHMSYGPDMSAKVLVHVLAPKTPTQ